MSDEALFRPYRDTIKNLEQKIRDLRELDGEVLLKIASTASQIGKLDRGLFVVEGKGWSLNRLIGLWGL